MVPTNSWYIALQRVPRESLKTVIEEVVTRYEVAPLELPEAGLLVLQMEDEISGEAFLVGELTAARATVRLTDRSGGQFDGASIIMRDDAELAEWIAICDALLTHQPGDSGIIAELVEEGVQLLEKESQIREAILSSTSVDFSLLEETEAPEE